MNNLLSYRNMIINESSNSFKFSEIKPYSEFKLDIINETAKDVFITLSVANENYIELIDKIVIGYIGVFELNSIWYSKDNITFFEISDRNNIDKIICKTIKFIFTGCTELHINNIELYENIKISDYSDIFKKYKIDELSEPPISLKNKNLGKMFTELMDNLIG